VTKPESGVLLLTCPKGHHANSLRVFEIARTQLQDGTFRHYCVICKESYAPSDLQKEELLKRLGD